MLSCIRKGLLAALVVAVFAVDSRACWSQCGCICWCPCWPCWPCCQPDTTPLYPLPEHPQPVPNGTRLYLQNGSHFQAFAIVYLLFPDGIYHEYEKVFLHPRTTAFTRQKYYQGDHLLIQTWVRGTAMDWWWHCRCSHLVTLRGRFNIFDVIHCHIIHTDKEPETTAQTDSATIVVELPADAKLTIDDQPTESTSGRRVFTTPDLEEGKEYSYTLKAEVVRDGRVQVITKKVAFRAGEEAQVTLDLPASTVAER